MQPTHATPARLSDGACKLPPEQLFPSEQPLHLSEQQYPEVQPFDALPMQRTGLSGDLSFLDL